MASASKEVPKEITAEKSPAVEAKATEPAVDEEYGAGLAYNVDGEVDYDKLTEKWGSSPINEALIERVERLTGKPAHPWLRRGLFYSHRDLDKVLDEYERGNKFYLYTGRGPSSESLHLGHLVPFIFTKYLQEAFDVPLVVQITEDEKFLCKDLELKKASTLAFENIKDIIALGFDPKKTFIFRDMDYIDNIYPVSLSVQKLITTTTVKRVFGFTDMTNIGMMAYPATQAAPSFSACFPQIFGGRAKVPCLVPCAIDQDPFFRLTRDIAPRMNLLKPSVIHSKFLPSATGSKSKASSTTTTNNDALKPIFLTDTKKEVDKKVKQFFSGGRDTKEEHQKYGGNSEIDVSYQYLCIFLLSDSSDEELVRIKTEFEAGRMLSGEMKKKLVDVLWHLVDKHQKARVDVTDAMVEHFMTRRPLNY